MATAGALKATATALKDDVVKLAGKANVLRQFGNWLVTPKGLTGYVGKLPFYGPYKGYKATRFLTEKGLAHAKKSVMPYWGPAKKTLQVVPDTAVGLGQMTVGPVYEAFKSASVDLPQRTFIDNARIQIAALFNIAGAGVKSAAQAIKTTALYPLNFLRSLGSGTLDVMWRAPRALLRKEVRGSITTALKGIWKPVGETLEVPRSVVNVPYQVGMETGLATTQTGLNLARIITTPMEGIVKGYQRMGKGCKGIADAVRESFGLGHAASFRTRFGETFRNFAPLQVAHAA